MSKKPQKGSENQEKVLTRYDLKMKRREEQKKKEARNKKLATAVGILFIVGLAALAASFPIRNYLTVHGTYVKVGGQKVSQVEFDYNYNLVKNNYLSANSAYLGYFGLDLTGDLSTQMYSDTLSWQDYFEQMAADNLVRSQAMLNEMAAAGFTYDPAEEYEEYEASLKQAASEEGVTVGRYVKELFGPYATLGRIRSFVEKGICTSAYYRSIQESKEPSQEEIQAYYQENVDDFDSVDYRMLTVEAQLPTEPTELADPVEENGSVSDADGEETAYQPSEAEIAAAMEEADKEAQELLKTVAEDGELSENRKKASVISALREWLFDSARKPGDTTVIANDVAHSYYVVAFEKRYLDETPTADVRIIMPDGVDGQGILDEWSAGEATEESFAALADQYNGLLASSGAEGGLFEAQTEDSVPAEVGGWLFEESRAVGDTTVITSSEDAATYVLYFAGWNDAEWKLDIQSLLTSERMSDYMDEITAGLSVEDPKGHLNYLKVQAQEQETVSEGDAGGDVSAE